MEITKDAVIEITKDNPGLSKVTLGLGWDVNERGGSAYDLDASALILTGGKVASKKDTVFFQNKASADGSTTHSGDNLTGEGEGDDEQINVDLSKVSGDRVDFVLTLYQARERSQSLADVKNAFIRLVDASNGKELLRYTVTGAQVSGSSLLFASLVKKDGQWSFVAEGKEIAGEITEVLGSYGYNQAA